MWDTDDMAKEATATGEIVRRKAGVIAPHFSNPAPLPQELDGLFDIRSWVRSLTTHEPYTELNPDFMAQRMMMLTLSATTAEEVMAETPMDGLQKLIPDAPWQGTGNIIVSGLYVAKSDQPDGNPTYMLMEYYQESTGAEVTTTTGATKLQLQFASLLALGIWPIEGQIKRTDRKDRGGRHLFSFYPRDI
jgi:hypothetical protein